MVKNLFRLRQMLLSLIFCIVIPFLSRAQTTVTITTGTAGTPAYNAGPIYRSTAASAYDASRYSYLYTQAELAAAGITVGAVITSLGWTKNNTATSNGGAIFRIYMKNSTGSDYTLASMPWATLNTGTFMVYENLNQAIPATAFPNYITFPLSTSFTYTGGDLEIATEWDCNQISGNPSTGSYDWNWSTVVNKIYGTGETALSGAGTLSSTTNSISSLDDRRPFLQLIFTPGTACTNPPVAGTSTSNVTGQVCTGSPVNLNLTGNSTGSGLSYEWESSPNNTTYTSLGTAQLLPLKTINPSQTSWYRCKVICSGGTPVYSTPIQVQIAAALSGTYTINSAAATAGTNFNNFTDATNALNCGGISGPVVFNVVAGSGPYNEFISLNDISGSSTVNTIRFNGNGATLQFATDVNNRHMIKLNGTKYTRIDSLNIIAQGTTYGYGAIITGAAQNDSITRCNFNLTAVTSATAANTSGIVFSNSLTSPNSAGVNGSNCYIFSNTITGTTGAGGINMAIALTGDNDNNIIRSNTIVNYYLYGIYVSDGTNNIIDNNLIHRSTKTTVNSANNIYTAGITPGLKITRNRIHSPGGPTANATGTVYGIYLAGDGTGVNPVLVANNAIYNMNQGSALHGIYLTSAPYNMVYHNTISLDVALSSTAITYGIYATGTNTAAEVKNNNVSITAGTAGVKFGFYYNAAASISAAAKNNFYINSTQAGTQNYGYYTTAYTTQAAFQAAYPAMEVGSPAVDPQFVSPATGNFTPGNAILAAAGVNLANVPTDIAGITRSSTPTPGAFEVAPTGSNNAKTTVLVSPAGNFCPGTQSVSVAIGNAGSNNITAVQVNWRLNGVLQTPFSYTGTLSPSTNPLGQNTDTVVLGNANLTAGANSLVIWTSMPNGTADTDPTNDTLTTSLNTATFALAATADTICENGSSILSLTPATGYATGALQWESSNDGITWTPIANSDNVNYTVSGITSSKRYRVKIITGGGNCYSPSKTITLTDVDVLTSSGAARCGPGSLSLTATGSAGSTLKWYTAATGGTAIGTGSSFNTPNINSTTTYYVAASSGGSSTFDIYNLANLSPQRNWHTSTAGWGSMFTVNQNCTLDSLTIYPLGTGTIQIQVLNPTTNAVLQTSAVVNITGTGYTGTPVRIPVGLNLTPGSYKLGQSTTGITNMGSQNIGTIGYPFSCPALTITSGSQGTGAVANVFYWFYDWRVTVGTVSSCESAREPVVATINTIPTVSLGNDTTICPSTSLTLNAGNPGSTYLWSNGAATQSISVTNPGTYSVALTTATSPCMGRDTIIVSPGTVPVNILQAGADLCEGNTLTLDAGNMGSTYLWSTGATTQTIDVTTGGTYTAAITSADGCSINPTGTTVTMRPLPVVNLGNDTILCGVGSGMLLDAANPGYTYLWNTGATSQTIQTSDSGTYSVTVTSPYQCSSTEDIHIGYYEPATTDGFNFIPLFQTQVGMVRFEPINPLHVNSYLWEFGDGNTSTQAMPVHTYTSNGNYQVRLTVTNECGSTDTSLMIYVDLTTGIRRMDQYKAEIMVYPNPAQQDLVVENKTEGVKMEYLVVYNSIGQKVYSSADIRGNRHLIDVASLPSGNYFIHIQTSKGLTYRKFSVTR